MALEWTEIALRLGTATVAGGLLGLNRDLHRKPTGLRTLGLVGLASALVVLFADEGVDHVTDAMSRIVQGVLTGIGFLGAGVILRAEHKYKITGLTSAARVWFTACVGVVCGAGQWRLIAVALAIAFVLLLFGGSIEHLFRRLRRLYEGTSAPPPSAPPPVP